jgi:hypothetical protein
VQALILGHASSPDEAGRFNALYPMTAMTAMTAITAIAAIYHVPNET